MDQSFPVYYKTFGNPANPCIILITGIGGQLIDWPPELTEGLAANGFYVVTFDNRDSGLSRHYDELGVPNFNEVIAAKQQGKPFTPPYTLEDTAADVIALMDKLQIKKAHIVGASLGGMVAQYLALDYPERVLSLTCIYTTSGDPTLPPATKEVSDYFSSSMHPAEQSTESAIEKKMQLYKICTHPDYFDEEAVKKKLSESFKRAHYQPGFRRLLLAMLSAEPRTERLKKLKVPTLIIHGDYDPVFPLEHGKQLAEVIPNSHLEIIADMGHGLPKVFAKKIADLIVKYFGHMNATLNF